MTGDDAHVVLTDTGSVYDADLTLLGSADRPLSGGCADGVYSIDGSIATLHPWIAPESSTAEVTLEPGFTPANGTAERTVFALDGAVVVVDDLSATLYR